MALKTGLPLYPSGCRGGLLSGKLRHVILLHVTQPGLQGHNVRNPVDTWLIPFLCRPYEVDDIAPLILGIWIG